MAEPDAVRSILVAASGFVYGPTSSSNLGDRAQLTRTVERLQAGFPGWRLVALANSLNDEAHVTGLDVSYSAIRYLTAPIAVPGLGTRLPATCSRVLRTLLLVVNARQVAQRRKPLLLSDSGRRALGEMDESSALFLSGAGTFNDLYALGVGGFWGILVHSMSTLGKPVVASGQQIGPLARLSRRVVAGWALRRIDLLGVRDPSSRSTALALRVPPKRVALTGDDAWDLAPADPELAERILERAGIRGPFIAAQVRFGPSVGWDEADAPRLAASLGSLAEELALPLVFVPCMTGRRADDRSAAEQVRKHLDAPSVALTRELDARTTKAILGRATISVGTANHFCVFAASMGTPAVGLHATPYMEQKLVGLGKLWPDRVTALPKEAGLSADVLIATAQQLIEAGTVHGGRPDLPPAVRMYPEAPVEYLWRRLESSGADRTAEPPYSARFVGTGPSETYEREFQAGEFMARVSLLERDSVRSALSPFRRASFGRHLDFACGTGRATGYVEEFVESTVGVDVSDAMLDRARDKFPQARFFRIDVMADPLVLRPYGVFDLATIWRFIAPAEPELRVAAATAVAGALADGALLMVNNNANRTSLHWLALVIRSLVRGNPLPSSKAGPGSISHSQLCALLRDAGFRVIATKGICYLPEQLTRRLPSWSWVPVERLLGRLNLGSRYAVNQLVLARREEPAVRSNGPVDNH